MQEFFGSISSGGSGKLHTGPGIGKEIFYFKTQCALEQFLSDQQMTESPTEESRHIVQCNAKQFSPKVFVSSSLLAFFVPASRHPRELAILLILWVIVLC